MKWVWAAIAWLEGLALGAAVVFVALGLFSRAERHMWMIFTLAIVTGLVMRLWPNVGPAVQWTTIGFCLAAYVALVGGTTEIGPGRHSFSPEVLAMVPMVGQLAWAVALAFGLALLILAYTHRQAKPWASLWLLGLLACSAAVAYYSGSKGAPGGSAGWLARLLHLDVATAEFVVHLARKVFHFLFYGLFAWFGLRSARFAGSGLKLAAASGLAVALTHACIDEWRQWSSAGRSGTPWDVLLDFAGMAVFLYLATRTARRSEATEVESRT